MADVTEWALVTGASGGLGAELAERLAARGYRLILTARDAVQLEAVAERIRRAHATEVVVEPLDLSAQGSAAALAARLDARGLDPSILINNAGFIDNDPARLAAMLQLNIVSLTELSHLFGRRMAARGRGRILLVGSMAAYQPDPLLAAYGASKAYVLSLGEALNVEFRPAVTVTVLSPGLMDTGFNAASGYETPQSLRPMILPPARVAEIGLAALFKGRSSVIAGGLNKLMGFAGHLMPRGAMARATYRMGGAAGTGRAHG
jgi:hypothetical protein